MNNSDALNYTETAIRFNSNITDSNRGAFLAALTPDGMKKSSQEEWAFFFEEMGKLREQSYSEFVKVADTIYPTYTFSPANQNKIIDRTRHVFQDLKSNPKFLQTLYRYELTFPKDSSPKEKDHVITQRMAQMERIAYMMIESLSSLGYREAFAYRPIQRTDEDKTIGIGKSVLAYASKDCLYINTNNPDWNIRSADQAIGTIFHELQHIIQHAVSQEKHTALTKLYGRNLSDLMTQNEQAYASTNLKYLAYRNQPMEQEASLAGDMMLCAVKNLMIELGLTKDHLPKTSNNMFHDNSYQDFHFPCKGFEETVQRMGEKPAQNQSGMTSIPDTFDKDIEKIMRNGRLCSIETRGIHRETNPYYLQAAADYYQKQAINGPHYKKTEAAREGLGYARAMLEASEFVKGDLWKHAADMIYQLATQLNQNPKLYLESYTSSKRTRLVNHIKSLLSGSNRERTQNKPSELYSEDNRSSLQNRIYQSSTEQQRNSEEKLKYPSTNRERGY